MQLWKNSFELQHGKVLMSKQPRVLVLGSISPQLETVARITLVAPMMSCGASVLRLLLWIFVWSPWTKTHQGLKSPFEAPGIYFATTTHYHYHPLLLPISIFLIGYMYIYTYIHIYIYICECRKGCVFLDLEIDPRVDKSWDRGFVSLPFLLGTSPSHPLPTL